MIDLMTASTGALGQAVLDALRARGASGLVVAGARQPERVPAPLTARWVDYDRPESLRAAFRGVRTLLLISSSAPLRERSRQHRAVLEAAGDCGVERVVYTSLIGADRAAGNPLLEANAETERALRASGMPWVILRNGLYLDLLPAFLGEGRDAVAHPAGDAPVAWITRRDIAAFIADVLLDRSVVGEVLPVVGPRALSLETCVRQLSEVLGRPLRYQPPAEGRYRRALEEQGIDTATAEVFDAICRAMRDGVVGVEDAAFETRLGRAPESVEAFLARTYGPPKEAS